MAKATGQFTIHDLNDIIISETEPSNPTEGMTWLDISKGPPYKLYVYTNGAWQRTDYENLQELDPEQYTVVQQSYQAIRDLDEDNKLTRYERSVVRGEIADITGKYLNTSDSMPTIDAIDFDGVGSLYTLRKEARDVGIETSDPAYTRTATAYESLRTYLTNLSPKAWDIDSAETTALESSEWESTWNEYYVACNNLRVATAVKREQNRQNIENEVGNIGDEVGSVTQEVATIEKRVTEAEQKIHPDSIISTVTSSSEWYTLTSDVGDLTGNLDKLEQSVSSINQKADSIQATVSTKVGEDEVRSIFRQEADSFTFSADQINFDGHVFGSNATFTGKILGATIEGSTFYAEDTSDLDSEYPSYTKINAREFIRRSNDKEAQFYTVFYMSSQNGISGTGHSYSGAFGPGVHYVSNFELSHDRMVISNRYHTGQWRGIELSVVPEYVDGYPSDAALIFRQDANELRFYQQRNSITPGTSILGMSFDLGNAWLGPMTDLYFHFDTDTENGFYFYRPIRVADRISNTSGGMDITGESYIRANGRYGRFGPRSSSYFHMQTDAPNGFYVYDDVSVASLRARNGLEVIGWISHSGAIDMRGENGIHHYVRTKADGEVRATVNDTTDTYRPVRASSHPTSSSILQKTNWELFSVDDAYYLLDNAEVYTYHIKSNVDAGIYDKRKIGMFSQMVPALLRDEDGIDPYSIVSALWKVVQNERKLRVEQDDRIQDLTYVIEVLIDENKKALNNLKELIK